MSRHRPRRSSSCMTRCVSDVCISLSLSLCVHHIHVHTRVCSTYNLAGVPLLCMSGSCACSYLAHPSIVLRSCHNMASAYRNMLYCALASIGIHAPQHVVGVLGLDGSLLSAFGFSKLSDFRIWDSQSSCECTWRCVSHNFQPVSLGTPTQHISDRGPCDSAVQSA